MKKITVFLTAALLAAGAQTMAADLQDWQSNAPKNVNALKAPVRVVNLWATWCGPCNTLVPVLEKLEADVGGRFILAKVDVDANQQIAAMFGVRSVPTCVLMVGGQPVDGFMGAQTEGQVRP